MEGERSRDVRLMERDTSMAALQVQVQVQVQGGRCLTLILVSCWISR